MAITFTRMAGCRSTLRRKGRESATDSVSDASAGAAEAWPSAGAGVPMGGGQPGPGCHLALANGYLLKTLMLGKFEDKGRRGWQRLESITNSMHMSLSKLQETVEDRGAWHDAVHEVTKSCT